MPKIVIGGNIPQAFKDKMAAKIASDVLEDNPVYTTFGVKDTPLVRVYRNGVYQQEFTSLYAAKCYIDHRKQTEKLPTCPRCKLPFKKWRHSKYDGEAICEYCFENEEPPCDCYGCATMRKPCVKECR